MFLPEIEIASDLIRDQLAEEAVLYRDLERFDPSSGNLLDLVESKDPAGPSFLLFPSGETNTNLSQ